MERAHVHRLVVVDDDQLTPVGIISTTDLVRALARQADRWLTPRRRSKEPGEPHGDHEVRTTTAALPVFDVARPTSPSSRASVMPGVSQSGAADRGCPRTAAWPAAIIPPGTAATRDFSTLAPRIPQLIAEACVGCMACVSACPDTAILATAQPRAALEARIAEFAAAQTDPAATARRSARPVRRRPRSTPSCPSGAASSRHSSASSSTRPTARAAPSASRSAPIWATTRWS